MKKLSRTVPLAVLLLLSRQLPASTDNAFNPAFSIILDGGYAAYDIKPENYRLAGFALGGEAGLEASGFSIGHSEITLSANIDSGFYGQFTVAFAEHEGELETELEEAFFETTSLGGGVMIRGGRFFSSIGYLNPKHPHAWDFRDVPLIYRGLFGSNYLDDGVQLRYVAPTDLFIELGVELLAGNGYPAGGEHENIGASTLFISVGGDIDDSSSWLIGASAWKGDRLEREYGDHGHGGAAAETPVFNGDSDIAGLYAVYKWAPGGNLREQHLVLQFEFFDRDETGVINLLDSGPPVETSTLDSKQRGWYLQAVWGMSPTWRTGVRFDRLHADNIGDDTAVLDEAGLVDDGHHPERASLMLEWLPSEFSSIRAQFNRDDSSPVSDNQFFLQYTFSLGAHGAHSY